MRRARLTILHAFVPPVARCRAERPEPALDRLLRPGLQLEQHGGDQRARVAARACAPAGRPTSRSTTAPSTARAVRSSYDAARNVSGTPWARAASRCTSCPDDTP